MTVVPTSGAVLKWARTFRGLSEQDAAERLGIPVNDLLDYETERKHPNLTLFEGFAAKYRLPQATLFLDAPPDTPPDPVDFRTVGGERMRAHSFDYKVVLSNIRTLLHHANRIAAEDENFVAPVLPLISRDADPSVEGERERKRLGISVDEQLGWDAGDGFRRWRAHLERQGVLIFQQKFPLGDGRGFTLYEQSSTPTIIINKQEVADTAKTFTIWHEYCHLLLRQPGVSDHGAHPVERFCNEFAAAFLMPTDALRRLLPVWPNKPVAWSDGDIGKWARQLKVSRQALALRLEHLGQAPDGFGRRFANSVAARRSGKGGNQVAIRLSEIGYGYSERLVKALDENVIDVVQFAEATGLGSDRVPDVREYVKRGRELAGAV